MVGHHQPLYSPSQFPRGHQKPNWTVQTINNCSVCGSTDLLQNIHRDFMGHRAQLIGQELLQHILLAKRSAPETDWTSKPNSLSPNHINYWNKAAICICTRAFCHLSSVSQMPPRDGPAKLHSSPSLDRVNFSATFEFLKHWRPELIFVSRGQLSLPVLRISQHERQSWMTVSALTYGKCLFIFIRHIRSPASPCTPWPHSCPMNLLLWRCSAGSIQVQPRTDSATDVHMHSETPQAVLNATSTSWALHS